MCYLARYGPNTEPFHAVCNKIHKVSQDQRYNDHISKPDSLTPFAKLNLQQNVIPMLLPKDTKTIHQGISTSGDLRALEQTSTYTALKTRPLSQGDDTQDHA